MSELSPTLIHNTDSRPTKCEWPWSGTPDSGFSNRPFPGPTCPHPQSHAGFRNGSGEGTISQTGGSGGLITVFPLPLELGQPRPMITMGARGNRARLPGQVCSLLEAGNRVFSDLRCPHTYAGDGGGGCPRQQRWKRSCSLPQTQVSHWPGRSCCLLSIF